MTSSTTAAEKRRAFRSGLESGRLQRFPGAFSPLVALAIEERGFDGVYISGAVLSADLGLPDIGLTTASEVAGRGAQIARVTSLPTLIDADTGFGEPANLARTVETMEDAGLSGMHIEDQVNPKRCGHLDHKLLVSRDDMLRRIRAAVMARKDSDFVICARTDARGVDGLDVAIDRAKSYVDAGADMIFPEALADAGEFEAFRAAVDVPLLANMTEFGKSSLLSVETLETLGFNMVIWPVTMLRLAMGVVEESLDVIATTGTQQSLVDRMQTRSRLYELVDYSSYQVFDDELFNFQLPEGD